MWSRYLSTWALRGDGVAPVRFILRMRRARGTIPFSQYGARSCRPVSAVPPTHTLDWMSA
jgi:hypothetical protein